MSQFTPKLTTHQRLGLYYVLSCFALWGVFYWGQFTNPGSLSQILLSYAAPILVVCIGGYLLLQNLEIFSFLEKRLLSSENTSQMKLVPILNSDLPVIKAWNNIAERTSNQESLSHLEEKIVEGMSSSQDTLSTSILSNLADGIVVTNSEGVIQYHNRAFESIFNLQQSPEITNRPLVDLIPEYLREQHPELNAMISANRPINFELALGETTQDGIVSITTRNLVSNDGLLLWRFCDITQNKLANEMRDQFLSSATHELRTPLTNIKAYAETLILDDEIDLADQKDFCNIINSEATRLSRLIDSLLDIKQIQAGSLAISKHETDLERLVEEVCEHVTPQMDQKQITFELNIAPKLPKLNIDKDKIVSALVNLLGNAAKYTPDEGNVKFRVEQQATFVRFHVEDSGIGIRQEDIDKVFDQFFRSDDPRISEISGNGLGLAFTHEVIELHGGSIELQSKLDKGTQVTVQLPV